MSIIPVWIVLGLAGGFVGGVLVNNSRPGAAQHKPQSSGSVYDKRNENVPNVNPDLLPFWQVARNSEWH